MFNFFIENKLISSNQSGFKPGDSCINQLLSITHEIYKSFDVGLEVRSVFLDISKAFDKVWHDGIIYKLTENGISGNLLNLLEDFLKERKQRVVLNRQVSTWKNINAGVPQGSILGPLLFLIYINDFTEGLTTNVKLFADDTSLFSVVHDTQTSANDLNKDLEIINNWAFQWKMNFNPDPAKQAHEVIFSRKAKEIYHPPLVFNNTSVSQSSSQKHLGVILDSKLIFDEYLKMVSLKISKTLGLLRKLHNLLPRSALITKYKAFVRPHLDYGDILYDQAYNMSFHHKLESIQYNACLAITGAIRGTSKEKLYQELGLESLQLRRWYRKLGMFYKMFYNLNPTLRNSKSFVVFKNSILKFIRRSPSNFLNCNNYKGIRLITRLCLGMSHLREHKFKHNFQDCLNPICSCGLDIDSTSHFLLHCPSFNDERYTLLSTLNKIDCKLLELKKHTNS